MRLACWATKVIDTHSEYALLIAFPWKQRLRERALMLRYPCIFFQSLPNPNTMYNSVWLYLHWMTPATLPLRSGSVVTVILSVVVSRQVF